MSRNSFRRRYTAEEAYDMLNEDSDASEPEEEAQEDIATVPTSVDESPTESVTWGTVIIVVLPSTIMIIYQVMSSNHSCTQVSMV